MLNICPLCDPNSVPISPDATVLEWLINCTVLLKKKKKKKKIIREGCDRIGEHLLHANTCVPRDEKLNETWLMSC
jgi:hypothetical protein